VGFGSEGKAFGESQQLVESNGAQEYEKGWVKDDVVRYPVRIRVGDETVV
jgi:hypothetical protein